MPICPACSQEVPAGFRFCGRCGAELPEEVQQREVRKVVTLLFCDVAGSTALGEQLDPETLRRVLNRYFDEISAIVARHGGSVEKYVGDAVMAVFGIPRAREDDALRAVRAASEIRDRLRDLAGDLGVELTWRTGINTGDVVVGAGHTLLTGDAVNLAARLEQAAAPGEVLIGSGTQRLVRDAVDVELLAPLSLKGKAEPVEAYRLLGVQGGERDLEYETPFIGRERELRLLLDAFERCTEDGCYRFTLVGAAGVGQARATG